MLGGNSSWQAICNIKSSHGGAMNKVFKMLHITAANEQTAKQINDSLNLFSYLILSSPLFVLILVWFIVS